MLDKLDFGKDDAESEKGFLQRVFFPTKFFERVKNNKKWLVLGRKGSGKTAVCLTLLRQLQDEQARVSLITPANLSTSTNSVLSKGSIDSQEASLLSWKYIFLVELGKYIVEAVSRKHGKNYLKWSDEAQQVRAFLVQGESRYARWLDKAIKIVSGVKKVTLKLASVEASAERGADNQEASALRDLLDDVSEYATKCIAAYIGQPIYLLIDKIDELWTPKTESNDLIIGLLQAAKEIRSQISQARVVMFLRSDIFDTLKFHDSDKYHVEEERIIWDEESLLRLVSLRIRASVGGKASALQTWQKVFPKTIEREESFAYILKHTLMRPRDLIQLCNHCKDIAENSDLSKIDRESFLKALPRYSRWKLNDLRDEYRVQYPFLEKSFWGVFSHGPYRFDREALSKRIAPYEKSLVAEFGETPFKPLDNLLQVLFSIGFIGAVKPGKILYFYQGGQVVVPFINEFAIHPAFRPALQTTESLKHIKGVVVVGDIKAGYDVVMDDPEPPEPSPEPPPDPA